MSASVLLPWPKPPDDGRGHEPVGLRDELVALGELDHHRRALEPLVEPLDPVGAARGIGSTLQYVLVDEVHEGAVAKGSVGVLELARRSHGRSDRVQGGPGPALLDPVGQAARVRQAVEDGGVQAGHRHRRGHAGSGQFVGDPAGLLVVAVGVVADGLRVVRRGGLSGVVHAGDRAGEVRGRAERDQWLRPADHVEAVGRLVGRVGISIDCDLVVDVPGGAGRQAQERDLARPVRARGIVVLCHQCAVVGAVDGEPGVEVAPRGVDVDPSRVPLQGVEVEPDGLGRGLSGVSWLTGLLRRPARDAVGAEDRGAEVLGVGLVVVRRWAG